MRLYCVAIFGRQDRDTSIVFNKCWLSTNKTVDIKYYCVLTFINDIKKYVLTTKKILFTYCSHWKYFQV